MGGIYQWLRTGATAIVLTGVAHGGLSFAGSPGPTSLWTQPVGLAAGDRFMALGYGRGLELWDWEPDFVPHLLERRPGPRVTALWGGDSTLFWCTADSVLRGAELRGSTWHTLSTLPLPGVAGSMSGSADFVAAVVGTTHVRFKARATDPDSLLEWRPPVGRPVAYISLRDSTAAVAGADIAFLVRLRSTGSELLDSLPLGDFAQAVQWAGDSLFLAFGFSGLRLATTQADQFTGGLYAWASSGSFGRLVLTDAACIGVDFFGDMELFERGQPLLPETRVSYGGTPRAAAGRHHEMALLTVERGLALLNLFTLGSPFWSHQSSFPGYVRDLESTPEGVLALADFAGVYGLGADEPLVVSHPYNTLSLDVEWPHLAATSLLGGVAVADLGSASPQPYAVVPAGGVGRRAVITGDLLFVAGDGACDTGLVVYELDPPNVPAEVDRIAVCGSITAMAGGPGVVAIAVRDSGVHVYDAITPGAGAVATVNAGEVFDELVWRSSDLWGRNRTSQLVRWQWNGSQLLEADRFGVPGLRSFDVAQETVVTTDSSRHVRAWLWQTGLPLEPIDSFPTCSIATCVALLADTIWAADGDAVARFELDRAASVVDLPVLPETPLLATPYPNPFNGAVTFTLSLSRGHWSVAVVDLLGRTVTRWSGVAKTSGLHRLRWSPEETGQAASGVYLIRAENSGLRQTRKVVYLK